MIHYILRYNFYIIIWAVITTDTVESAWVGRAVVFWKGYCTYQPQWVDRVCAVVSFSDPEVEYFFLHAPIDIFVASMHATLSNFHKNEGRLHPNTVSSYLNSSMTLVNYISIMRFTN